MKHGTGSKTRYTSTKSETLREAKPIAIAGKKKWTHFLLVERHGSCSALDDAAAGGGDGDDRDNCGSAGLNNQSA